MKAAAMAVISLFLGLILATQAMAAVKYESLERRNGLWQVKGSSAPFTGEAVWMPQESTNPVILRFESGIKVESGGSAKAFQSERPKNQFAPPQVAQYRIMGLP